MSTPAQDTSTSTPSTRQLAGVVALAAVLGGFALGLYALTPAGSRAGLLAHAGTYVPSIGAAGGLLAAWLGLRRVQGTQDTHGAQLATITQQTNGVLTGRITDAVAAALDARGLVVQPADALVPAQRSDTADAPAPVV